MKIFLDTANLNDIEEAMKRGFIAGLTTNPSLLAKESNGNPKSHIRKIIDLLHDWDSTISLSIELMTAQPDEMRYQAELFLNEFEDYDNLYIKVPIGWEELKVIRFIHDIGGGVNCTACMSYPQAMMAASTGVGYVSMFWGRIRDGGENPQSIIRQVRTTLHDSNSSTQIIVGSIRTLDDFADAFIAGADIVTVPPKFLPEMCKHPQTDRVVAEFMQASSALSIR